MNTHFPRRLMLSFKMESIMVTGSSVVRLDEPFSWTALDMRGLVPSLPELSDSLAGSFWSPLWMTGAYSSSLSSSTMTISGYWLQLDQQYEKEPITFSNAFNKFILSIHSHGNFLPKVGEKHNHKYWFIIWCEMTKDQLKMFNSKI